MGFRVPAPDGARAADGLPILVLPPATELQAGYRLEYLAVGGMSVVYKAFGATLLCAKEVPSEDTRAVMALVQEKALLERLRHPGIVRVHGLVEEDGFYYLLMDFVDGQTLDKTISPFADVFLQERIVLEWGRELCDIFAYLHRQDPPIIYRDLKPRNVMKDRAGRLRLVDFGIARYHKEGQSKDTQSMGTAATASPEHYTGQTDQRSDIFTLGATLHFLLSNGSKKRTAPFEFPPLRTLNPSVSPETEAVLARCLEPQPSKRFTSMEELADALDRLLGKPSARPTAPLEPTEVLTEPPAPRKPIPWGVLGALAAGLLVGVAVSWRPAPAPPAPVVATPESTPVAVALTPSPAPPVARTTPRPAPPVRPRATPAPRPQPTPEPVVERPRPTPKPVAAAPSYPTSRPRPRTPSLDLAANDPYFGPPWLFPFKAPRGTPPGQTTAQGRWTTAGHLQLLIPDDFQVSLRNSTKEVIYLRGTQRDIESLRVRWTDYPSAPNLREVQQRFVEANPLVAQGASGTTQVMDEPALTWQAECPFLGTAVNVRSLSVFWYRPTERRLYVASAASIPYRFAELEPKFLNMLGSLRSR